jgi:hypothetical protein
VRNSANAAAAAEPGAPNGAPTPIDVQERRQQARRTYAYGEFVDWAMAEPTLRDRAEVQGMILRYRMLDQMMTWLKGVVAATPQDRPLLPGGEAARASEAVKVWGDDGRVVFDGPANSGTLEWSQLAPLQVVGLAEAALRVDAARGAEAQRHRIWVTAFRQEYELPVQARGRGRR